MSVTIISAPPKAIPSAGPENASAGDSSGNAPDFASLLLGKLVPVETELKGRLPQTDFLAVPDSISSVLPTEASPADPAAMLAALGLLAQNPGTISKPSQALNASPDTSIQTGKSAPDTSALLQNMTGISSDQAFKSEALGIPGGKQPPSALIDETAEGPAKFAAALGNAQEFAAQTGKKFSAEVAADSIAAPSLSAPGSANTQANTLVNSFPSTATHLTSDKMLNVPTPVRDQNWSSDFGQKIVWLAASDKQSAQITLNPPQMGPIEIALNVDKGNATASFTSANAEVREAIETAMPRLREMFASAGIELGQTNVSAESFKQQAENSGTEQRANRGRTDTTILGSELAATTNTGSLSTQRGVGLVDLFA